MKKNIVTLILLFSFILSEQTLFGQTINDIFKSMPAHLLPGVSEGNKTMLIVDSATTAVPHIFGEIHKLKQSTSYLRIKTSEVGDTQLKLLPISEDSILISVIKTVCGNSGKGACNSHISFYTANWVELDSEHFIPQISPEMFMDSSKIESENYKYALSLPDIYPISATFDETSTDLTIELNYKDRLSDMQEKEFEPYLYSNTVLLKWNGSNFK